jgi:hypothetical protein
MKLLGGAKPARPHHSRSGALAKDTSVAKHNAQLTQNYQAKELRNGAAKRGVR